MKTQLRKQMKATLLALGPEAVAAKSRAACDRLVKLEEFQRADTVMLYLPIAGEVDTTAVALAAWRGDKTVLVPKVSMEQHHMLALEIRSLNSNLVPGSYGIKEPTEGEPCPVEDIDFIIVPALAFDRRGYRLGRGGGFYDRFLAQPGVRAVTCGLGFSEQLLDELPVHEHDKAVMMLATDREVLRFTSQAS